MAGNKADLIWQIRAQQHLLKTDLAKVKSTMSRAQRNMNKVSKQISTSLQSAFGVFAAGQVFMKIGRTIANFEKQMDKVAAVSGATEKEISSLRKEAIELGRASKFTAVEIGKLQEELARKGFSASQISASSDAIRKLATVADSELGPAASSLAGTLKGFNLEASESERVANVMAESFSKSSLDLEKFTVATSHSGAIANALGISLERNTARLGALVDANIDASKAGTDLRKIYVELNDQGIKYNDALDMVGKSHDKVATATQLVGIRSAAALVILSEQREKVEGLTTALTDNNKELESMVRIMEDNLLTDLDKLSSAFDGMILTVENGENRLNKAFRGLTQGVTSYIGSLTKAIDGTIEWHEVVALLIPAMSQMSNQLNTLKAGLEDKKAFDRETKALEGFNAAMEAGITTSKEFLEKSDEFGNKFEETGERIMFVKRVMELLDESQKKNTKTIVDQSSALSDLLRKYKDITKMFNISVTPEVSPFNYDELSSALRKGNDIGLEGLGFPPPEEAEIYFETVRQIAATGWASINDVFVDGQKTMSEIVIDQRRIFEDMINGIAGALDSGAGIKQAFAGIFRIIGDNMQKLGFAILAVGIGLTELKASLLTLQGPAAVQAGLKLAVAGSLLKAAANSFAGSLGGGGGGGSYSGGTGGFQNNFSQQSIQINGAFRIEGNDLVSIIGRANDVNERQKA